MKKLIKILGITPDAINMMSPNIPFLVMPANLLRSSVEILIKEDQNVYLSAIIGQEWNRKIDLMYFFVGEQEIILRFELPLDHPSIDSISDILIGAAFYERECHEMLGTQFKGLSDSRNLLLPIENHQFPLRETKPRGES